MTDTQIQGKMDIETAVDEIQELYDRYKEVDTWQDWDEFHTYDCMSVYLSNEGTEKLRAILRRLK